MHDKNKSFILSLKFSSITLNGPCLRPLYGQKRGKGSPFNNTSNEQEEIHSKIKLHRES